MSQQQRHQQKRAEKLEDIREQVEKGTLIIRKMTAEERKLNAPRKQRSAPRRRR